jgi:Xaa-Pro aminopeptidase
MFQSFDPPDHGAHAAERLARLRARLAELGVDAFLAPRGDAHQGESVAPRDERLAWLTGFTGSAGLCAVLPERAALFVDGRYTLQAREQSGAVAEIVPLAQTKPKDWLAQALKPGWTLALDPMLHTLEEVERYAAAAETAGASLRRLDANPVDAVWEDQPGPPMGAAHPHPLEFAGEPSADKRARLAEEIAKGAAAAALITLPDSLAWLLNLRGADAPRSPAPQGFALLRAEGSLQLFMDADKLDARARAWLGDAVEVAAPAALPQALDALAGQTVRLDRASAPAAFAERLKRAGAKIVWGRDPCQDAKAVKNSAELAGMRAAHLRDAAAMARFLRWLDETAPAGGLTEIDVVKKLESFRCEDERLRDMAFDTICGAGEHGAIVHYRVTRASNRPVRPGETLLIDSGGQYEDGTTDVTRTVAIGEPPAEARRLATLALKGMIAISRARFPEKTAGRELDPLARLPLWMAGHDFDHGTGHGVGAALNVHEGPASLSRRGAEPLRPGMILSNEPGCYVESRFGIRIENLVSVTEPLAVEGGARPMLAFETLTRVPIDRRLIDLALLAAEERAWLDAYHAEVRDAVSPLVDDATRVWLGAACAALG